MSLFLVPASRENLEESIEKSVELSFAKKHLPHDFIYEILRHSGLEGIRCWALTKNSQKLFNDIQKGDEVLLTEKGTGLFTHYGVVIGKIQSITFGNALWPVVSKAPWENIYFLANITKVHLDKSTFLQDLGYKENFPVYGAIKVKAGKYNYLTLSDILDIPVYSNVAEVNENRDFSAEDFEAIGTRRIGHSKFSKDVKTNYGYECAVCGITEVEFLIAGHISGWAEDLENRLNPQNGICLCALHDKAFEHGYIGLTENYKIIINTKIEMKSVLYSHLIQFKGVEIKKPFDGLPDKKLLKKHREKHNLF